MKKFVGVLILLIILISAVSGWIYMNMGVGQYVEKMQEIDNLPNEMSEMRESAREEFAVNRDGKYNGVVMGVSVRDYGSVWVWGSRGPKYYEADEYSVFSYYSMCKNRHLIDQLESGRAIKTEKNIYQDVSLWNENVEVGDYIVVMNASEEHGGNLGKLREAWAYDWWPMMPVRLDLICQ